MVDIQELNLEAWYMQKDKTSRIIKGKTVEERIEALKKIKVVTPVEPEVVEIKKEVKVKKRRKYDSSLPKFYKSYLARANKKGISFCLSVEQFDFITGKPCVYCGTSNKIGIDRYDSNIGYELENCQPCCTKCNLMKFVHNHEEFLAHVKKVYNHSIRL